MPHVALIPLVQSIGYPGITLAIYLESGIPIGFFLPGASLLFTAGLLASKGLFNPWLLIVFVTIAAILGDSTGYWFGNKIGVKLFLRPNSRWFRHEHLEQAKEFYERYGMRTVFLARFVPIVRTFVPIVAGIVHMRYRTFLTYNILGACAWAAGITALGYFLGAKVPFVGRYLTPIVLVIVVVTTMPLLWDYLKLRKAR